MVTALVGQGHPSCPFVIDCHSSGQSGDDSIEGPRCGDVVGSVGLIEGSLARETSPANPGVLDPPGDSTRPLSDREVPQASIEFAHCDLSSLSKSGG